MRRFFVPLLTSRVVSESYTELRFPWPGDLRRPLPGQFLSLGVNSSPPVFLRRPFSLSGFDGSRNEAAVMVLPRGPASEALCRLRPGEMLDIIGPRGFPFPYHHNTHDPRPIVLVGGGIGVGPLQFAAQYLLERHEPVVLLLGFREPAMIPALEFPQGARVRLACEKAPLPEGVHLGKVLDLAEDFFDREEPREVWTCGPPGMLHRLASLCLARGIACSVLMEEMMGCAVGACMGCAVPVNDGRGYLRACTEGPVFDAAIVDWEGLWT